MASQSKTKTKTVKFEVDQLVEFNNRFGRVSRIAKNGGVYVIVLGETTVLNETREELRVKKADLRPAEGNHLDDWDHVKACLRQNIAAKVSDCRARVETATFTLAPEYIPSLACLTLLDWEGSPSDKALKKDWGIDLLALATAYAGKAKQSAQADLRQTIPPVAPQGWDKIEAGHEVEEIVAQQASVVLESLAPMVESIQSALDFPTEPKEESQSVALADATHALRELTFSVTRHSILTAFIDVALNKNIPGYHHQVAGNIKNLMAAAFDPLHDAIGYARINTWMRAALELLIKNKERVAKMLSQPIEAAPIKIDRVTKLGMWLDKNMDSKGTAVDDLTSAYDSCYMYDSIGKKLETCTFVVVEVAHAMSSNKAEVLPITSAPVYYPEYLTAQSAIKARQQHGARVRSNSPDWHLYCGIVPVYKTGLALQAAVEDVLASVMGSLK